VWVTRRALRATVNTLMGRQRGATYPHDLVRQRLRSLLPLSEIGPRSVQLRSIQLLIKTGLDAKQLLIGRKLIPSRMSRRTSTECDVVSEMSGVMSMSGPCGRNNMWGRVSLPSQKLAFAAWGFLADVSVSLECYQTEVLSMRKVHKRAGKLLQSPFGTLASAGPEDQVSISGAAIKS